MLLTDRKNIDYEMTETEEKLIEKHSKYVPEITSNYRKKMLHVPEAIYKCSGIKILGKRIKSLIFTTDVAIIKNNNAHATFSVYPFTPQLAVTDAILSVSSVPVFIGCGGGPTPPSRVVSLALQAELKGAYGVVLNAPTKFETIREVANNIDIALVCTVADPHEDFMKKVEMGADILNVSGGKNTVELVKLIRKEVGPEFPIIATGGPTDETIIETIAAGANAITYTPPSTADIFAEVMASYRHNLED